MPDKLNESKLLRDSAPLTQEELDAQVNRESDVRTRRSFLVAGGAALSGYGLYRWIAKSRQIGRQQLPLRRALEINASIAHGVLREGSLAPTFPPREAASDLRLNGTFGIREALKPESWRLQLVGTDAPERRPQYVKDVTAWQYQYIDEHESEPQQDDSKGPATRHKQAERQRGREEAGESSSSLRQGTPGLLLNMADLQSFPHVDLVTEFKCIEGWSEIVQWGGIRLAHLIAAYPPARTTNGKLPRYVYMETPDGDYYCGYDMSACTHPQSLLVYAMSGRPINHWHGAPLRLHMPIKYGYKQIKRIGLIAYTDLRPDDYWTKLGYDWYAGL